MGTQISVYVTAGTAVGCANCGTTFWMTESLEGQRRKDHKSFYCPNGHDNYWPQESDAERYKRLMRQAEDRAAAARAEADQAEASRRAWKGQVTRLRNRAAAGACPYCGENVYQLKRHVQRKHADEATRELTEAEVTQA